MKLPLAFLFAILSFISTCQNFKKSEFKVLYAKTINAIKTNDTTAFINLWQYPDSVENLCGDHVNNIIHNDALVRHFAEISTNWSPYIHRLKYHDVLIEESTKEDVAEWRQGFCYIAKLDDTKNKLGYLCTDVIYFKGKLVYPLGALLSPIKTE